VIEVAEAEEVQVVMEALAARVKAEEEVRRPTNLHRVVDLTAVVATVAQEDSLGAMVVVVEDLVGVVEVTIIRTVENCERV
jgi:hypothetical protein